MCFNSVWLFFVLSLIIYIKMLSSNNVKYSTGNKNKVISMRIYLE